MLLGIEPELRNAIGDPANVKDFFCFAKSRGVTLLVPWSHALRAPAIAKVSARQGVWVAKPKQIEARHAQHRRPIFACRGANVRNDLIAD
jgi:hypothetical protein